MNMKWVIGFALGSMILFFVGFGGATFIVMQRVEIPEIVVEEPEEEMEHTLEAEPTVPKKMESLNSVAKELEMWQENLEKEKEQMVTMDQELLRREKLLQAEREALDREREKILTLQRELESRILAVQEEETRNFEDMAALFGKMKIDEVVAFLRMFPDNQISRLMSFMSRKQLAKVLETWSSAHPGERQRIVDVTSQMRKVIHEPLVSQNER